MGMTRKDLRYILNLKTHPKGSASKLGMRLWGREESGGGFIVFLFLVFWFLLSFA